jgi:uncharacterized lipoprotein YmbA
MSFIRVSIALLFAAMVGCRSAPVHYYSLASKPPIDSIHPGTPSINLKVTTIPASADRLQLVVHQGSQVSILENHEWIAPLPNEIEAALSFELVHRLNDDSGSDAARSHAHWIVGVNVLQLEAYPADRVFMMVNWNARLEGSSPVKGTTCYSQISEPVPLGIDAVVNGYRTLISNVAGQIAQSLRAREAGTGVAGCSLK